MQLEYETKNQEAPLIKITRCLNINKQIYASCDSFLLDNFTNCNKSIINIYYYMV